MKVLFLYWTCTFRCWNHFMHLLAKNISILSKTPDILHTRSIRFDVSVKIWHMWIFLDYFVFCSTRRELFNELLKRKNSASTQPRTRRLKFEVDHSLHSLQFSARTNLARPHSSSCRPPPHFFFLTLAFMYIYVCFSSFRKKDAISGFRISKQ